jgi:hypothetical protein
MAAPGLRDAVFQGPTLPPGEEGGAGRKVHTHFVVLLWGRSARAVGGWRRGGHQACVMCRVAPCSVTEVRGAVTRPQRFASGTSNGCAFEPACVSVGVQARTAPRRRQARRAVRGACFVIGDGRVCHAASRGGCRGCACILPEPREAAATAGARGHTLQLVCVFGVTRLVRCTHHNAGAVTIFIVVTHVGPAIRGAVNSASSACKAASAAAAAPSRGHPRTAIHHHHHHPCMHACCLPADDHRRLSCAPPLAHAAQPSAHDWTACPYNHPGERARRRCLLVHKYNAKLCPDMQMVRCAGGVLRCTAAAGCVRRRPAAVRGAACGCAELADAQHTHARMLPCLSCCFLPAVNHQAEGRVPARRGVHARARQL